MKLEFAPEAETDLLDIAVYFARDNPARARNFVAELEERCVGLLDFHDKGRERPDLAQGLRSMPHGRYMIYYTPRSNAVRIERILHAARDVEAQFGEGE